MAKAKERQDHPDGPKMTLTSDQRAAFKLLRQGKGLSQQQLAHLMGVSNGTISNLENGRHEQVFVSTYTEAVRVLKATEIAKKNSDREMRFSRIVEKLMQLDARSELAVEALIDSLLTK
jgi:transcriptional regulator with XRE-family HTH domain